MITSDQVGSQPQFPSTLSKPGCLTKLLVVFSGFYILGVVGISQLATWGLEQAFFTSSRVHTDPRWIFGLVGGLALWIPLSLLARLANNAFRPLFRTWAFIAWIALWMFPTRFLTITSSQAVAGWQIIVLAGILVFERFNDRRNPEGFRFRRLWSRSPALLTVGLGGCLLIPWVTWGALGSILDTLLGFLVALLAGIVTALAFEKGLFSFQNRAEISSGIPWQRLFGAPMTLVILAFGLGLNMNEWILLLVLPPLGWVALSIYLRSDQGIPAWQAIGLLLALGISGPLVCLDPDELAFVVTSGAGELMEWAAVSGVAEVAIAIGCALMINWILRARSRRILSLLFTGGAWFAAVVLYFFVGNPGFFGERLFVIFKEQIDVTSSASIQDYSQRRAAVYHALVDHANLSQAGLRQDLDRWGIRYQPFYLVNALEVDGGPLVRLVLQSRPEVDRVLESPHLRPLPAPLPVVRGNEAAPASPAWNLTQIRANLVWDEIGVTGKGILIGQSDSGVDGSHPELRSSYRGQNNRDQSSWFDPWFQSSTPVDIGGHGTHTLATALGKTVGVAPEAEWIGCVNLARNLGNPAFYLDCMQFMLAPFPQSRDPFRDGRPEAGAQVLNNSWGCPVVEGCDPETFRPAVRALESAGIFVVASAGNEGDSGCGSVTDPLAIYPEVLSVGAVDSRGQRTSFSSLGPVTVDGSNRIKPDLAAPGEMVLSAFPKDSYAFSSGTSMAGPHLVGTVALIWSANPKLIGDIEGTRQILIKTAQPYKGTVNGCGVQGVPNDSVGYGIVDAYAAVQMALAQK